MPRTRALTDAEIDRLAAAVAERLAPLLEERRERLLSKAEVANLLGCTQKTVDNHVRRGLLPPPIHFGCRISRWKMNQIMEVRALNQS